MELISPISKEWLVYFDIGNREPFQRLYKTRSHAASAITNYKNKIYYYRYNKSVKLPMKWNGKVYEGRMAGMDFTSTGPKITITQESSRG